jgi:antitoxin PrlF
MQLHYFCDGIISTDLKIAMTVTLAPCSESTLTDRYQTTIPDPIRKALGLNKRDKICYTIESDGRVVISRADQTDSDPIIGQFLNFLAQDIEKNPQHVKVLSTALVSRVQALVADIEIDLDATLTDEDE